MNNKMGFNIEVKSIKMLKYLISTDELCNNSATIICSSYDVNINIPNVLILNFDDINYTDDTHSFSQHLAHNIHTFIDSQKYIKKLYICCDSGQSRSSAIAAATYKYLGINDIVIWKNCHFSPNELVYKIMCNEYGIKISNFKLRYLKYINKKSLKNTIRNAKKSK